MMIEWIRTTYASHGLPDQLSDKRVEKSTLPVSTWSCSCHLPAWNRHAPISCSRRCPRAPGNASSFCCVLQFAYSTAGTFHISTSYWGVVIRGENVFPSILALFTMCLWWLLQWCRWPWQLILSTTFQSFSYDTAPYVGSCGEHVDKGIRTERVYPSLCKNVVNKILKVFVLYTYIYFFKDTFPTFFIFQLI